jgi:hypothetical protein
VLFTFPSRYWFTIGRQGVLRLGGWSPHVQTGFHVSRPTLTADHLTATGLSPILLRFPTHSPYVTARPGPRSLAATDGVSIDVLSSGYLDVSVPRVRSWKSMYSTTKYLFNPAGDRQKQSTVGYQVGFPIRKFPDQRVLSPPRNLSQSATSFIASCRLGIHQTPFSRLIRSSRSMTVVSFADRNVHSLFPLGASAMPAARRGHARSVF